jgi:hypothetical protein
VKFWGACRGALAQTSTLTKFELNGPRVLAVREVRTATDANIR